ncbi:Uncharacterised protein [Bordetella pertussis]|nr:Uncharacterised protein [Bordetella pertussis]
MASRIFSPQCAGSSAKPGRPSTHSRNCVKRTVCGSASGCVSARAAAIS